MTSFVSMPRGQWQCGNEERNDGTDRTDRTTADIL